MAAEWTSIVNSVNLVEALTRLSEQLVTLTEKVQGLDDKLTAIEQQSAQQQQQRGENPNSGRHTSGSERRVFPNNADTEHIRNVNRAIRRRICVPFDSKLSAAFK